jgi:hypothetical protein
MKLESSAVILIRFFLKSRYARERIPGRDESFFELEKFPMKILFHPQSQMRFFRRDIRAISENPEASKLQNAHREV